MTNWTYNGQSYAADLFDGAFAARLETAVAALREAETAAGDETGATFIAGLCGRQRAFFDALFGPGAGAALLGEADNARAAVLCHADFVACMREQVDTACGAFAEAAQRYDPARVEGL